MTPLFHSIELAGPHVHSYILFLMHYTSCTYSLLSHLAVVAHELGLPTIVGVSGGLMKRLKTGMRVHVDAGKGKITIVRDEEGDKGQRDA